MDTESSNQLNQSDPNSVSQPFSTPNTNVSPNKNYQKPYLIINLVVILLLVIAGIIWFDRGKSGSNPQPYKTLYTPREMNSQTVLGNQPNSGISFLKLNQYAQFFSVNYDERIFPNISHADFAQLAPPPHRVSISALSAAVVPMTSSGASDHYAAQNFTTISESDSRYQELISKIKAFILTGVDSRYSLDLSKPVVFTNSQIKSNAWSFSYTLTDTNAAAAKNYQLAPNYKGTLIYAFSQKADYYLVFDAPDYNWISNQDVWQAILKSIKIDQP